MAEFGGFPLKMRAVDFLGNGLKNIFQKINVRFPSGSGYNFIQRGKLKIFLSKSKKSRRRNKMAIELKRTGDVHTNGVKMLVYGQAKAGKTTLIGTLPDPVILSAEGGLLSLQSADLPYIEVGNMAALRDAYEWLASGDGQKYPSVAIDSISEIAEVVLAHEKANTKDPRAAYGEMQDQMQQLIRAFRDLPGRNVYMTAKLEKQTDEMGRMLYSASMPGNKMGQMLPFFFDEIFALRVEKDGDGNMIRTLQCQPDGLWVAGDRSGKLDAWEAPDLGAIINKIAGSDNGKTTKAK